MNIYQTALDVQSAVNLSAVVHSWSQVMEKVWALRPSSEGTDWVNRHPVNVLFASKVADLTGCEVDFNYSVAYAACKKGAQNEQTTRKQV